MSSPERLTFAWPAGAHADVTYTVRGFRSDGRSTTQQTRMQSYEMRVRKIDNRGGAEYEIERIWPITKEPNKSSVFDNFMADSSNSLQNLVDDLPEFVSLLRVNEEGQLVSIGGLGEIEQRLERALKESEVTSVGRRQMKALTSEESLQAMSHQAWAALVTIWNGRHLADDFPIGDRSGADVPAKPLRVEVPGSGSFEGRVPCRDGDEEALCVKLHWKATPQGEDAEEALQALEGRAVDDLKLTREITVVADPATLLPYSTVDYLKASRTIPGKADLELAEEMTRTRRFDWTLP